MQTTSKGFYFFFFFVKFENRKKMKMREGHIESSIFFFLFPCFYFNNKIVELCIQVYVVPLKKKFNLINLIDYLYTTHIHKSVLM